MLIKTSGKAFSLEDRATARPLMPQRSQRHVKISFREYYSVLEPQCTSCQRDLLVTLSHNLVRTNRTGKRLLDYRKADFQGKSNQKTL
jgi:hypothetical protein